MRKTLTTATGWLDKNRDLGAFFIRLAFGLHLMYSSADLFDPAAQREFAGYLATIGVPLPLLGAYLCHVVEFFGGLLLILGLCVRPAAALLLVNFAVALFAVRAEPYKGQFQALQLFAVAAFLLLNGAGGLALDGLQRPKSPR